MSLQYLLLESNTAYGGFLPDILLSGLGFVRGEVIKLSRSYTGVFVLSLTQYITVLYGLPI